jgi:uncharacterized protein (DUF1697 family)
LPVFVVLLRGVNVGGRGKVAMSDLQRAVTSAGFRDVRTVLNAGSLVCSGDQRSAEGVARSVATAVATLGLETAVLVRTPAAMSKIVAQNPFPDFAASDPSHLTVTFLPSPPAPKAVAALRAAIVGSETIAAAGAELYATYPDGIGDSKLTAAVVDRTLGLRGTARNWNTVLKLAALAGA